MRFSWKTPALLVVIIFIAIFLIPVLKKPDISDSGKLRIVTTYYVPYELVHQIGGANIEVVNLTSGGVEPHDYEPSPADLAEITKSDLFILNGAGLDHWALDFIAKYPEVRSIMLSDEVKLLPTVNEDPHFWLDPLRVTSLVTVIARELSLLAPENETYFFAQAQSFQSQLTGLDQEFQNGLKNCQLNKIVVAHDAFGYLGETYGFEVINISGLSHDEEPSGKQLAEISEIVKTDNIKYIFYESASDRSLSDTVARETGTELLELNPLETLTNEELNSGENYVSIMRGNLLNLKIAMQCI